jgi:integrase
MASIAPHKNGYRAQVFTLGVRESQVFRTKREASAWASARETEIRAKGRLPPGERYSIGELLDKYMEEVVPKHRSSLRETAAVKFIRRRLGKQAEQPISKAGDVVAGYRDARLGEVREATVLREMKILGSAFEEARVEWKWIATNPIRALRKPASSPHRDRVLSRAEIRALLERMGYPRKKNGVALAFLLALRTGMRLGEICNLTRDRVFDKHVVLDATKTNPRHVPLSRKARRIMDQILARKKKGPIVGMKAATLSGLFIRYRKSLGLEGITFHDSRHTAATWMSQKVDVLTLCRIFGWTDPKMAMVYFNPKAGDIADLL